MITKHYGMVLDVGGTGAFDEMKASNPTVIRDGYIYRMYYTAQDAYGTWTIGMATSINGFTWTKHTSPVITPSMVQDAGYDVTEVSQPCVVKYGGVYYLFFHADLMQPAPWNKRRGTIFLANSTDGVHFTIVGPVLYPIRNSMEEGLVQPYVVYNEKTDMWMMYYIGNDFRSPPVRNRVFVAYSSNLIDWSRPEDNLVLSPTVGDWDLRLFGLGAFSFGSSGVMLAYSGEFPFKSFRINVGLAFSDDFYTFYRYYYNPVLLGAMEMEKVRVSDSSIMFEGGRIRVWYDGYDGSKVRIFYAELLPAEINIRHVFINRMVSPGDLLASDPINGRCTTIRIWFHADWKGKVKIEVWDEEEGDWADYWNYEYYESVYSTGYEYYYDKPCKIEVYTLEIAPMRMFRVLFMPDPYAPGVDMVQVSCWVVCA